MLAGGDLVPGHVHQLDAAGRGEGALRGGGEVMMLAPPGNKPADQVDVQESGGRRRGLADGGLAGHLRELRQGPAEVSIGAGRHQLTSQCLRGLLARAEQQVQGGMRVVLHG